MAGETVNYYYLGHLLLALPAHALWLEPSVAYNLAVAGLFALCASAVFTLAGTLWAAASRAGARARRARSAPGWRRSRCASCSATSRARGRGWAPTARRATTTGSRASRVIADTINEFPAFSFTLGDLHAHVLAIPFTLLALAFALQVALDGPRGDVAWRAVAEALAAGLAVGALYAINSWSYPVAAGLLVGAVVVWMRGPARGGRRAFAAVWTVLVLVAGFVLVLPFWLDFDPAARGVGGVAEHRSFARWAGDNALIYGVLGWAVLAAYAGRLLAARRRCGSRPGAGSAPRSCCRCWRRWTSPGVALLAAALGVAVHAALSRAARGARALPLAARRRRARVRARARARLRARRVRRRRRCTG